MDLVIDSVIKADATGQYDVWKRRILGDDGDKWKLKYDLVCVNSGLNLGDMDKNGLYFSDLTNINKWMENHQDYRTPKHMILYPDLPYMHNT
jgi:hypothetical protein